MVATVRLRSAGELKRISRELRSLGDREVKKRFSKELRAEAKPVVPAVRAAIRRTSSKRAYRADGLRGRLSKAVKLEVKTSGRQAGVRIAMDGRKMPDKQGSLPRLVEGEGVLRGRRVDTRWRHPVYGQDRWVQQRPKPFFYRTVRVLGPRSRRGVNRALDRISRDIT